jgi:hypothetical protein
MPQVPNMDHSYLNHTHTLSIRLLKRVQGVNK